MRLSEYQERASKFAVYENEVYPFLGLAEEVGGFLGYAAKMTRGDDVLARFGSLEAARNAVLKEAGDVLWMLSACLGEFGMTLQEAAELNISKLEDRKERGVIKGSGDNR